MVAVAVRTIGFLAVWVSLIGLGGADLAIGLATAVAAAWLSVQLLPPRREPLRWLALLRLVPHFLAQSVIAGVDVARRALDPRMPLQPGFVSFPLRFGPGPARNVFASWTSLLPGTLPVADDGQTLLYHCLDVTQPIATQLGDEQALLAPLVERTRSDA